MTKDTEDYIESWERKMSQITGNNLNAIFERFQTLYVLHNRLYNDSFRILSQSGQLEKSKYGDHEKASTLVIKYISEDVIFERFKKNDNLTDLESIALLIENKIFNINLADGVANPDVDKKLMDNLRSTDPYVASKAALMAIYNVRANVVHGEKHFEEHQRILLEPLMRLTKTIIDLQIESYGKVIIVPHESKNK